MTLEERQIVCSICKIKLGIDEKRAICTNCEQNFHFDHLQVWLRKNSKCPNCKHIFSFEFMKQMRPQGNIYLKQNVPRTILSQNTIENEGDGEVPSINEILAKIGFLFIFLFFLILLFAV